MATGSVSMLSGDVLEKARRELNEEPEQREEAITELRRKIEEEEASDNPELDGVVFQRKDSSFLLRFLRARKFDVSRALTLYINYYRNRLEYKEVFDIAPHECREVLHSGLLRVLKHRMKDGAKVVVFSPGKWDMDTTPNYVVLRSMLLVMEKLMEEEETQVHGIAIFQVYEDLTFMKVMQFTQTDIAKKGIGLKIMQDGFPARLKGLHMIEPPWYISLVLTLVKPFMKEKLRQRLNTHSGDWATLHEVISPDHLPCELGGSQPSLDTLTADALFTEQELAPEQ